MSSNAHSSSGLAGVTAGTTTVGTGQAGTGAADTGSQASDGAAASAGIIGAAVIPAAVQFMAGPVEDDLSTAGLSVDGRAVILPSDIREVDGRRSGAQAVDIPVVAGQAEVIPAAADLAEVDTVVVAMVAVGMAAVATAVTDTSSEEGARRDERRATASELRYR